MPVEFKLPDLGEGIHEGEIIEVLVRPGDSVKDGQPVLVVETDKATAEVPAPVTGTVKEVRVKAGQTVKVGDVLMVFLKEGESEEELKKPAPEKRPEEKRETRPPAQEAERLAEVSEKTTAKTEAGKGEKPTSPPPEGAPVAAAPSTRRLARELGVDLNEIKPSGPGGRITPEDVRAAAEAAKKPPAAPERAPAVKEAAGEGEPKAPAPPEAAALPQFDKAGPIERLPLRSIRRATAKHLALSWSQIPHVTHMDTADITELEEFRRKHKKQVEDQGGALSLTVFAVKAVVSALKKFPRFNASLDMQAEEIILKHYYSIGIAVDTDRGLIVPVIRDVDRKSIVEIAVELKQTAERARDGKTTVEDLQGGTFTITNIGSLGGTWFSPIINYPQAAILGMAQARLQPVVVGDEKSNKIATRLILPLLITFDHRLLDGADAARFLNSVIEALQSPEELMMIM